MTAALLTALVVLGHVAQAIGAPPVRHELDVRLDPAARTLAAVDRIRLSGVRPHGFALAPGLVVERLVVDGAAAVVEPIGPWHLALDERPVHEVVVTYRGALAPLDPERPPEGPAAGPDGAHLASAGWYPLLDAGRFEWALSVEVPAGQRAVAPGRLLAEEKTAGGGERSRFAGESPSLEISLFAGPYEVSERWHRGRRLRSYLHPEIAGLADDYLARTAGYLDLYDGWIGAYPYAGFAVVSSPLPVGLGFPALTCMGRQVLGLPFILDTSLGHEVLHSWWGNGVAVDVSQGNWAEGLTTFMADYTFAERKGAEEARQRRLAWLREFALLPAAEVRPLSAFTERRHGASQVVGYHKAAMVFLMLRDTIGSAAFDRGIRDFWTRHRFRTASWSDLRRAFERASGVSLGRFFAQWVGRDDAPSLALSEAGTTRRRDDFRISFTLRQQAPAYALSLPVLVSTAVGPVRSHLPLAEPEARLSLSVAATPSALAIDPEWRILRRLAPEEVPPILRRVAFDPEAVAAIAVAAPDARAAAEEVAARLLERAPAVVEAPGAVPLLVVGTEREVEAFLARSRLPPAPPEIAGRGTARAWAARHDRPPLAVVEGRDAAALAAVARPLPHHGAQSWIVFEGARAVGHGVWEPATSSLAVTLQPPAPRRPGRVLRGTPRAGAREVRAP